jgi:hypothetical protein
MDYAKFLTDINHALQIFQALEFCAAVFSSPWKRAGRRLKAEA